MGKLIPLAALAALACAQDRLFVQPAIAVQKKVALVIGNAAYAPGSALKNPVNDARAMAAELRRLGFDVTELHDLPFARMGRVIDDFSRKLARDDFGFFYFAGHGVQVQGRNYLVPVDYSGNSEADVSYQMYAADQVRDKMEYSGARLRVIVLDACRNNPFRGQRTQSGGLAPMTAAEGTLIAYATADNSVADDSPSQSNGLFTKHLVQALRMPGAHLREMFEAAKGNVFNESARKQLPAVYDLVVGQYYFTAPAAAVPPPPVDPMTVELTFWNSVKDSRNPRMFESYVQRFPRGQFVEIARERIAELSAPPPKTEPAPPPAPVSAPKSATVNAPPEPSIDPSGMPRPGTVRRNPSDGLNYVWIPPGSFQMGCSPGDNECFDDEKPAHQVTISRGYWMGQTEVTAGAYKKSGSDSLPAVNVDWSEAKAFCEANGGRLPTEAEWEYAARAGSTGARYGALEDIAWYSGNSGSRAQQVATKRANAWGLFDMLGNVWEWVADWYDPNYFNVSPSVDPVGPSGKTERVVRGGSWYSVPWVVRASNRRGYLPALPYDFIGFRCVREAVIP
jgi:formylglycine-generating enzyme required for sulfatase activity